MNNYEYLIACLPVLNQDDRKESLDAEALVEEIKGQCSKGDRELVDFLLEGHDPERLNAEFYRKAAKSGNAFIRDFFAYDLLVRNTKVEYLNKVLGREEGLDVISQEDDSLDGKEEIRAVLATEDILARERGLDDLMWKRIEDLTIMHVFDMDVILGFTAKLKIIDRWLRLDPETGRILFRKLVEEIRNTK